MKYITLIIGLLVVGCVSPDETLRKSVVGTYEFKDSNGDTYIAHLLHNGTGEAYINGKKDDEYKWKISPHKELQLYKDNYGEITVYRINYDRSLTKVAHIRDGCRADIPKEYQHYTFKNIK